MTSLKSNFIIMLIAAAATVCFAGAAYAEQDAFSDEEIIKKGELLSLQRSIEIALKRQPNIIAARSSVNATRSKVGQAQANYFPQIDLSSGYSRTLPVAGTSNRSSSAVPASSRSFDQYTSSAALKQNLFDFGKTSTQVRIQDFNLNASRFDLENITDQMIFNVKQAYYSALQTKRNRDVAVETVKQFEQHLEQAKGFYKVGTKPKFDVTKAEVDLSNARLNLIKAENAVKTARVTLNNAIGVPKSPEYILEDNLSFKKFDVAFEEALSGAFDNRADIQSAIAKRKAAEESVRLAQKGFFPYLTGNAAYNWAGSRFPLEDGWNAGVTVTLPLFSGFLTKHQVDEARATLDVQKANEELLKQNVFLDVQQAYLNLKAAEDSVSTAELAVTQATENLEIANGRYAAGVGNPIEVTDAQVAYSNAKTAYIQALSDYKIAQASLEKAMGRR